MSQMSLGTQMCVFVNERYTFNNNLSLHKSLLSVTRFQLSLDQILTKLHLSDPI